MYKLFSTGKRTSSKELSLKLGSLRNLMTTPSIMRYCHIAHRNEVRQTAGYKKIINSCERAMKDGYGWIWIDTCCIDKHSSPEVSGAR